MSKLIFKDSWKTDKHLCDKSYLSFFPIEIMAELRLVLLTKHLILSPSWNSPEVPRGINSIPVRGINVSMKCIRSSSSETWYILSGGELAKKRKEKYIFTS